MNAHDRPEADRHLTTQSGTREVRRLTDALAELRRLQEVQGLTSDAATRLATEAASAFLGQLQVSAHDLRDAVTLLCELANLDDPTLSQIGIHGIFPSLVEPLGDAFTPTPARSTISSLLK